MPSDETLNFHTTHEPVPPEVVERGLEAVGQFLYDSFVAPAVLIHGTRAQAASDVLGGMSVREAYDNISNEDKITIGIELAMAALPFWKLRLLSLQGLQRHFSDDAIDGIKRFLTDEQLVNVMMKEGTGIDYRDAVKYLVEDLKNNVITSDDVTSLWMYPPRWRRAPTRLEKYKDIQQRIYNITDDMENATPQRISRIDENEDFIDMVTSRDNLQRHEARTALRAAPWERSEMRPISENTVNDLLTDYSEVISQARAHADTGVPMSEPLSQELKLFRELFGELDEDDILNIRQTTIE